MTENILKAEERIAFSLRTLYKKYGYLPYKMSKFELYDLYVANKDFLVGDGVITFNDTDGKLLALKPDVTLSIIKNGVEEGEKRKVYYHENVYRISGETKQFKEIPQVGVECLGELDAYDIFETVKLAAESLREISSDFALDVAHLGVLSAILDEIALGEPFNREVMTLLAEKNLHETQSLCEARGVSGELMEKLLTIVRTYGDMKTVLSKIQGLCQSAKAKAAFGELETLYLLLKDCGYENKIRFDFSVVNDMKYYNGIVFKGFVDGVCEGVLSGGQYDRLMARMGKKANAIGFAVYLDLLEGFQKEEKKYDVDVLVLYDDATCVQVLAQTVQSLVTSGKSVWAQKCEGKLRYGELLDLREGKNND